LLKKIKNLLHNKVYSVRRFLNLWKFFFKDSPPIYTKTRTAGLKIHLGAGPINIQGWINVDAREYSHTHIVANNFDLAQFADGSISEIYMCHVLEHFSFSEVELLLRHFKNKLCIGGVIRLSVPSFDKLVDIYCDGHRNIDLIKFAIMGGQDYEFNFHKSIYNQKNLSNILVQSGYTNIEKWDTLSDFGADLGDWSSKYFPTSKDSIQISLNLKALNGVS